MRKLALLITLCAFAGPSPGQTATRQMPPPGRYTADLTHSSVHWRVKHMGLSNYTARFTRFDITLEVGAAQSPTMKVTATIDPTSIRTDYADKDKDWDAELKTDARFFDAGKFAQITFTSTRVERRADSRIRATGELGLRGVTRPVVLDVVYNGMVPEHPTTKKPAVGFSARTVLKRTAWGFAFPPVPGLSDEVEVIIESELVKRD